MEQFSCDIIRDLIPNYADGICSKDTEQVVAEHLEGCEKCRTYREEYQKKHRGMAQKAVLLQAIVLFFCFALVAIGTVLEMRTGEQNAMNGGWAACMVIPAAAMLLSAANWYLIAFYKSKKQFRLVCFLLTLGSAFIALIVALVRYRVPLFYGKNLIPAAIALVICAVVWLLSGKYAKMMNKN